MAAEGYERVMKVTAKEMADAKLPLQGRDYCAHLLIPLLKCRKETYFMPWKCHHEKHLWERCEYDDLMYRVREKERQKLQLENKGI
ncbi:PREDICTED: NADH dehydrogenase [ubiquinone] 1 beta subcomplex subunit 7-like [Acropora digitifera]|uniref:NADH dehydrogenase [ubiquinone] 1 beta subcomplex subunit 7-like n=1 Tax=Acropora digitifera TaxID=70779 RepID=UPI00077A66D5|nr:PREDICTED: NADH dehydrogenase [ubiquinone] 1 beta subcomplex subunit 7-like [Acropora digitifera]XP_015775892.1 PREDICTED: NADH dehydrogenase [ubiquinone] 1 beta subcomplex subunit 7-like [Acropora digitifera]XP_029195897.1 NADH dehydrogenase [ubiquinone] 1 beta subcomplex subunit 7-like [Acropora millepora]